MRVKGNNVFVSCLALLGVRYTKTFANQYFNENPHKYNLFGQSKMLSDYGVENAAIEIPDKEHNITEIQTPFIAHFGGDFVAVYQIFQTSKTHIYLLLLQTSNIVFWKPIKKIISHLQCLFSVNKKTIYLAQYQ